MRHDRGEGFDPGARAAELDAGDPLARFRDEFAEHPDVVSYLDGNSLGRPLRATAAGLTRFVEQEWGGRLIRGWDEEWMDAPTRVGDRIGSVALGAAPGQTVVADSTSVLLYKLIRLALDARPGRSSIVVDVENFPTDRFIIEGIAAERAARIRWVHPDRTLGVTTDQVRAVVDADTAVVVVSEIAFKSGFIADIAALAEIAHAAGALLLSDVCHSVGSIDVQLDATGVDLAVGCTYKYLNGGPGSPAFAYLSDRLQGEAAQPIQGWMGAADPFGMVEHYRPSRGIRQLLSGTPPILAMQPMLGMLDLVDQAGIARIRAKSELLTAYVIDYADAVLAPLGVTVIGPRDPAVRGSHVTLEHPDFRRITGELWARGVIPDFRPPAGLRIGLSPLSTSFEEVHRGLDAVRKLLS